MCNDSYHLLESFGLCSSPSAAAKPFQFENSFLISIPFLPFALVANLRVRVLKMVFFDVIFFPLGLEQKKKKQEEKRHNCVDLLLFYCNSSSRVIAIVRPHIISVTRRSPSYRIIYHTLIDFVSYRNVYKTHDVC